MAHAQYNLFCGAERLQPMQNPPMQDWLLSLSFENVQPMYRLGVGAPGLLVSGSNLQFFFNSTSDARAADHGGAGGDDNPMVTVTKFTPNVVCSRTVSGGSELVESCQGMVDRMDAGSEVSTMVPFGTVSPWDPGIGLPFIDKAPFQESRKIWSLAILSS